jgi:lipoprotein signal peptidase
LFNVADMLSIFGVVIFVLKTSVTRADVKRHSQVPKFAK